VNLGWKRKETVVVRRLLIFFSHPTGTGSGKTMNSSAISRLSCDAGRTVLVSHRVLPLPIHYPLSSGDHHMLLIATPFPLPEHNLRALSLYIDCFIPRQ
jgi:hypothetical protein